MSEKKPDGLQMRRAVMGDAFVDRALGNATDFTQPLQDFVNQHAWGGVWTREGLPLRTRSLITLAALTALKCPQELKGHVRGALNNGCTVEEIREALLEHPESRLLLERLRTTYTRRIAISRRALHA